MPGWPRVPHGCGSPVLPWKPGHRLQQEGCWVHTAARPVSHPPPAPPAACRARGGCGLSLLPATAHAAAPTAHSPPTAPAAPTQAGDHQPSAEGGGVPAPAPARSHERRKGDLRSRGCRRGDLALTAGSCRRRGCSEAEGLCREEPPLRAGAAPAGPAPCGGSARGEPSHARPRAAPRAALQQWVGSATPGLRWRGSAHALREQGARSPGCALPPAHPPQPAPQLASPSAGSAKRLPPPAQGRGLVPAWVPSPHRVPKQPPSPSCPQPPGSVEGSAPLGRLFHAGRMWPQSRPEHPACPAQQHGATAPAWHPPVPRDWLPVPVRASGAEAHTAQAAELVCIVLNI